MWLKGGVELIDAILKYHSGAYFLVPIDIRFESARKMLEKRKQTGMGVGVPTRSGIYLLGSRYYKDRV
jgi:hypothetical protein